MVMKPVMRGSRTLHLIDVENLAGQALPAIGEIRKLRDRYDGQVGIASTDLVVIACSHKALLSVALGWPGVRYRVRSGPDGADLELLDVLDHERVTERFRRIVIASGDGRFAESTARLAALGCHVTIVSRRQSLAVRLWLAAHAVIRIDDPAPGRAEPWLSRTMRMSTGSDVRDGGRRDAARMVPPDVRADSAGALA